jgi:hypothetical protein
MNISNQKRNIQLHCHQAIYNGKKQKLIVKCLIILVAVILCAFTYSNKTTYYDMYGNTYNSQYDVLYYSKDGSKYTLDNDTFYLIDYNGERTIYCDLDENGYVIDTSTINEYVSKYSGISYNEDKNTLYFNAKFIFWDENGTMYYKDANNQFNISEITVEQIIN